MTKRKNILFLCTRLADYMYRCIIHLAEKSDYNVVVVRYRPDVNSKYDFSSTENTTLFFKDEVSLDKDWVSKIDPQLIYISGWGDREYKRVLTFVNNVCTVMGLDNPWTGTWKQYIHTIISPFTTKRKFSKIWVAGPQQYSYAQRLGFKNNDLMYGVYSADDEKFSPPGDKINAKTVLYVGRLIEYKRPFLLACAFTELQHENRNLADWKLVFAGKGPIEGKILSLNNSNISVEGFVTPENLPGIYQKSSIFCLPSKGEHWGVVVHEAGLSGLPLLLSDTVSSGNALLVHGYNGYKFATDNKEALKKYLGKLMTEGSEELHEKGRRSKKLSDSFSKDYWAAQILANFQ